MSDIPTTDTQSTNVTEASVTVVAQEVKKVEHVEKIAEKPSETAKSGFGWKILGFVITCLFAGGIGALSGYYAAMLTPVPAQVVVFDLDKAMKLAAEIPTAPGQDPRANADYVVALVKSRLKQYTNMGMVVVDSASVVDYPHGSLVSIDDIIQQVTSQKQAPTVGKVRPSLGNRPEQSLADVPVDQLLSTIKKLSAKNRQTDGQVENDGENQP